MPDFSTIRCATPISKLEQRMLDAAHLIERWFRLEWMECPPPFYTMSIVRNASFKVAPIDTYFFPTNLHHLDVSASVLASQAITSMIDRHNAKTKRVIILARRGDESPEYLKSLLRLKIYFEMAGMEVRIGSLEVVLSAPKLIHVPGNPSQDILIEPLLRSRRRLGFEDFFDAMIINNDRMDEGIPGFIEDVTNHISEPPLQASWSVRKRSNYYACHEEVAKRLGTLIGIDPWLLYSYYETCGPMDLGDSSTVGLLKTKVDALFSKIRRKYREYGHEEKPFVVLKHNNRYAGASVIAITDEDSLEETCRSLWQHPHMIAGFDLPEYVLQEGVYSRDCIDTRPIEMVVNTIGKSVIGAYCRMKSKNKTRQINEQTRTQIGPLSLRDYNRIPVNVGGSNDYASISGRFQKEQGPDRFYLYDVAARLSALAAALEMERHPLPEY